MENENKTVLGVYAPPARPNPRGFLILAVILSGPVALAGFGIEFLLSWHF